MPSNQKEYVRKYNRERQIQVYPKTSDLTFIEEMRLQKGMTKSAVAKHLIGLGVQQLRLQKNKF